MNYSAATRSTALSTAALLLLSSVAIAQAPAQKATPAGNVKNGKKIYTTYGCYQCHGRVAHGGGPAGPRIGPSILNYQAFAAYVRHPKAQMPPYTVKSLSDQEMADIYAYVQTFPKAPDPKTIPLLQD
ncbi:MAG: cytochrome c [Acidobacteria bacterium]|nr:cytochrome c [Acidobacteriota bacterium]